MSDKIFGEAYSFDDVLLIPEYSSLLPKDVNTATYLTRNIKLNNPLVGAAMDTVIEAEAAIVLSRSGGFSFIHRNFPICDQVKEVEAVKRMTSRMIANPVTVTENMTIAEVKKLEKEYKGKFHSFPVVRGQQVIGIITSRNTVLAVDDQLIKDVMTRDVVTINEGFSDGEFEKLFLQTRLEKFPVVNRDGDMVGMVMLKDFLKSKEYPHATRDELGRLRVGAAIGVGPDRLDRTEALLKAGADSICIDTSHGHSRDVLETVREIKYHFPGIQLVAGNVATTEGAKALIDAGVDGVKVGIGPGSICTTRIVSGVGVPQLTAIMNCRYVCEESGVPLIADGGIKFSGDITKAIGAGAHTVMIGGLFAGTDESPGEMIFISGDRWKIVRGMGSIPAMKKGSKDRYKQGDVDDEKKLVPEGVVSRVPYRGKLVDNIHQLMGGLRSGMGYCGCRTIDELRQNARFYKISAAGLRESHVHDVVIHEDSPNYQR